MPDSSQEALARKHKAPLLTPTGFASWKTKTTLQNWLFLNWLLRVYRTYLVSTLDQERGKREQIPLIRRKPNIDSPATKGALYGQKAIDRDHSIHTKVWTRYHGKRPLSQRKMDTCHFLLSHWKRLYYVDNLFRGFVCMRKDANGVILFLIKEKPLCS